MSDPFESVVSLKQEMRDISPNVLLERKQRFSQVPPIDKSTMWDYSLEQDGEGNRILGFLVDDNVLNFKLLQDGERILAEQLPDSEKDDFGRRGNSTTGRFQVHKSTPTSIYGTIHGGKKAYTFSIEKNEDGQWEFVQKRNPLAEVGDVLKLVREKTAASTVDPYPTVLADTLFAPLTAPYPKAMLLSGLLGAGAMGVKNLAQRVMNPNQKKNSLILDMLLGGGLGAGGAAAFKYLGEPKSSYSPQLNYTLRPNRRMIFGDEPLPPHELFDYDKKASMDFVDVDQVRRILQHDPSLTPSDKRILLDQLSRAAMISGGGRIDMNRIRGGAFGALFGYILAKVLRLGTAGTAVVTALGAFAGSSRGGGPGRKYDPRGFFYY